jgi:DNA-binding NtrC family response regulator
VIPPLRSRPAELDPLIRAFVATSCRGLDRPSELSVSDEALDCLRRYSWPGNVRELRNVIERAVVLCTGNAILPEHLPGPVRSTPRATESALSLEAGAPEGALRNELRDVERARIVQALEECGGNQTEAAKRLGISRRTLLTRLDQFKLPRPRKN